MSRQQNNGPRNFSRQNNQGRQYYQEEAKPRAPVYDCWDTIQEHRYPTMEELKPMAEASLPWKINPMQKDATYASFANIDIRAELLVAAKYFSETYIEAANKIGVEKLQTMLNDIGIVERSVFIIMNKNRTLMGSQNRRPLPTAVFINCVNLGILALIIKLETSDDLTLEYNEVMDLIQRLATQEDGTYAEVKRLVNILVGFEAYDQVKDIARIMFPMFTSITNPSHVHRIHPQDKTAMKSAILRMIEPYSTQPISSNILNASLFDLLTNNRDILSMGCRDYLYNLSAESVNFLFTALLKSKTLRSKLVIKHFHPQDKWSNAETWDMEKLAESLKETTIEQNEEAETMQIK